MWDWHTIRRKANSLSRRIRCGWAPAKPVYAWLDATSRCNLRCRICALHRPDADESNGDFEDMRPEVYDRLRRELIPGLADVCLSGIGEPFMASLIDRMLDDMIHPRRRILIVTNGTIIKRDYLERLVRTPAEIMLSLDGTTPEVLEPIRVGVRFERIVEFMKMLKDLMDHGAHPRFEFTINWVVTRANLEQLTDAVELANRFGIKRVSFTNFEAYGRTDDFALAQSLMNQPETVLPHWKRAKERAEQLGICVPEMYFDCPERSERERRRYQPRAYDEQGKPRRCTIPWWGVYVETDGAIKPCCIWPPDDPMGNILDQPLRRIWNSRRYRALRRSMGTPAMPELCKHCFLPFRI